MNIMQKLGLYPVVGGEFRYEMSAKSTGTTINNDV
jgi:hypothetical protein